MRAIKKPEISAISVYKACISKIRNRTLREKYNQISSSIDAAEKEYQARSEEIKWFMIERGDSVDSVLNKSEMEKLYSQRMVGQTAPGRSHYDKLKNGSPNGICPLCGQRSVSTLDHFLPKSNYPLLVVLPLNLIPACADCNKAKLNNFPDTEEKQVIHPYYDDVEKYQWLCATVKEDDPGAIKFYTANIKEYDEILNQRIKHHFAEFKLADLYRSNAYSTVSEIKYRLNKLFEKGGAEAVRIYLSEEELSRRKNYINSWQTAAYQAMMNSDWFCGGGFNNF